MAIELEAPSPAQNPSESPTSADQLRALLVRAGLSQRAAAKLLGVDERTMRMWCAGQGAPPASVFRALSPRLTHADNLRRMIESNEKQIEALQDGRIVGMGFGPGPSVPASIPKQIRHLQLRNEEHRALLRKEEAFQRQQEAHSALFKYWLPHGSGVIPEDVLTEMDRAKVEFKEAQAEIDRIANEIRTGVRS